jgi:hypothetical protein
MPTVHCVPPPVPPVPPVPVGLLAFSLLHPPIATAVKTNPDNTIPKEALVRFITLYLRVDIPKIFVARARARRALG